MVTAWGPVTRRVVAAVIALVVLKPFFNHSEVYMYKHMLFSSLAGHTYFASARLGRAQRKGGRGKNTYGVSVQVFVR